MEQLIADLTEIVTLLREISGICVVWKRTQMCITESRQSKHFMHDCAFCNRVKDRFGHKFCRHHDTVAIPAAIKKSGGEPFFCPCPGGAMEYIVPVGDGERIFGVLFFGPFAREAGKTDGLPVLDAERVRTLGELGRRLLLPLGVKLSGIYPALRVTDSRISAALTYLGQHYGEKISLQSVARRFFLSPSRFSHLFSQQCGSNFTDYLLDLRLAAADDLLRFSAQSIADIAKLCGFSDAGHFATLYRRKYRRTPRASRGRFPRN